MPTQASGFLITVHTATTGPFGKKALHSERTVVSLHSKLLHRTDGQGGPAGVSPSRGEPAMAQGCRAASLPLRA